jgi:hypothetical protein
LVVHDDDLLERQALMPNLGTAEADTPSVKECEAQKRLVMEAQRG